MEKVSYYKKEKPVFCINKKISYSKKTEKENQQVNQ